MLNVVMPAVLSTKPIIVASVLIEPGDAVKEGQELFNIETSKRAVPIPAPADGTIVRVLVKQGDVVAIQDVLAEMEESCPAPRAVEAEVEGAAPRAVEAEAEGATPRASEAAAEVPAAPECASKTPADTGNHAELLIIGGGTGGYVAALYAAKKGKHVTLVERDTLGGTCLNRGCIPTKTLISSACLHRDILHASEWGLVVEGDVRPDMGAIIERKNRVVHGLVEGLEYLMGENRICVIRGTARFDGNAAVVVRDGDGDVKRRFTFDDCIIATGSAIRQLSLPGADLPKVLDTDKALDCAELPSSIVIVGGGVTGSEFAFMYANLGVDVTLLARRNRVLHLFDEEASTAIMRSAAAHGIRVELEADVKGFAEQPDGSICTTFEAHGQTRQLTSDYVLLAGGRSPMTDGLGLETTGVAVDEATGAVLVDERMRTNVEHVYAIGDVNGRIMLAHAASYQGRIAIDDILGEESSFRSNVVPSVAYTDPEVATVGVGVDAARRDAARYTIGTFSFAHNGKALAENSPAGYVSLVSDANDAQGALCGATIVGAHASDLIGYAGLAISSGISGEDVRQAVFAHPTTAEAIHEAACDLAFGALHE